MDPAYLSPYVRANFYTGMVLVLPIEIPNAGWQSGAATWPGNVRLTATTPDKMRLGTSDMAVPAALHWEFEGAPGYPSITAKIEVREGVPELSAFELRSPAGARGLRNIDFAAVNVDVLITNVMAWCGVRYVEHGAAWQEIDVDPADMIRAAERARRGRPRMSAAKLEEIAQTYRDAQPTGRPTAAVAARYGVQQRTAESYVQRARRAGLLPPTTPGKARA